MIMEVKIIEYKGKKILYADHRGAKDDFDMIKILYKGIEIEKTLKEGSLLLANFENSFNSFRFLEEVKKTGKFRSKIMKKMAFVGITGIKIILLKMYIEFNGKKGIKTFDNEDEARDWLVL